MQVVETMETRVKTRVVVAALAKVLRALVLPRLAPCLKSGAMSRLPKTTRSPVVAAAAAAVAAAADQDSKRR